MASLAPALRKKLEDAVKEARDVAEAGARAALEQLAVHAAEPFAHLSPEDRELRNRLRARARQLGDGRDTRTGAHQIDHLVVECAYEHWHRMLFARFLAENGVLMANSEALGIENTPVTLEECEELAADEGAANGWELAGRYASKMLPQIFRPDAPVLAVHLPPERQRRLEQILAELSPETFKASDALGWVYQFWQAKKKDEVNASGVKIGADELPAVTQLFTEPYMVDFLLHNTLGAWWAGKVLAERPELARTAKSEDELREACALPGAAWPHLRFVKANGTWLPAAGTFSSWPSLAKDLRVLDPCCGSGHFLVTAFEILAALRAEEERLSATEAGDAVLTDNLYGLEIDERCTQIAAFALAMAAWTSGSAPRYRRLPSLNLACSGLSPIASRDEWRQLVGRDIRSEGAMNALHTLFSSAPVLGSLLAPQAAEGTLFEADYDQVRAVLDRALDSESAPTTREMAVTAHGIARAAKILVDSFSLVVTNVPYLGRARQHSTLSEYCAEMFPQAKADLATAMTERCRLFAGLTGAVGVVSPQAWMYLGPYRQFRQEILKSASLCLVAQLGSGAFRTISGEVVNVSLTVLSGQPPATSSAVSGIEASAGDADAKASALVNAAVLRTRQAEQLTNPDSRILIESQEQSTLLSDFADSYKGVATGDLSRFVRGFWEVASSGARWKVLQTSVSGHTHCGGRKNIVLWDDGAGELFTFVEARLGAGKSGAWLRGEPAWGKRGVAVSQMAGLSCSLYDGDLFDENTAAVIPKRDEDLEAIYCYLRSETFRDEVRRIDSSSLKVPTLTLLKVPFDAPLWRRTAREEFASGLPERATPDPTEWLFPGKPAASDAPLQVAVARLLGYEWPKQERDHLAHQIDDDGVVCLPSVRGEESASDRIHALLADAFGSAWNTKARDALLASVGAKGKGLDWWLQNKFFEQHCQLFQHRPFIWHIWDGIKKDGFGALVNYHKLDRKLLETLTYTYLGDWIRRQQDDAARNVDGASERLDAARRLQQSLELILEGEKPHDIFVRWKPLHEQPIGWEPDLNDGVRVNIRPFMSVPDVDKKGAGVLRYKPNIHWKKDRGTDPDDAPWFELGPSYGEPKGARINDHHLSLAEKRAARERAGGR